VLVQLSILVVAFIKSEVILSFLGFGVPGRRRVVGQHAERSAERDDPRQVVAARGSRHDDGDLVTAFSLFTTRCAMRSTRSSNDSTAHMSSFFPQHATTIDHHG
jgi:hypothetical protein